jgi:DMSO/TMAO reductase YedYZ molybdopterin-dependent catalytic subunit
LALPAIAPIGAQSLVIRRADGSDVTLDSARLAALPRVAFEALDHGAPKRFEGVAVTALLRAAEAGPVDSLRGAALRRALVFVGRDGYTGLIALPELDMGLGDTRVFAVDREDGKPLSAEHGPWRIVVVGDRRGARWVRQLVRIEVVQVR